MLLICLGQLQALVDLGAPEVEEVLAITTMSLINMMSLTEEEAEEGLLEEERTLATEEN